LLIRARVVTILLRSGLYGVALESVAAAAAAAAIVAAVVASIITAVVSSVVAAIVVTTSETAASEAAATKLSSLECASQGVSFLNHSSVCDGRNAQKSYHYIFDLHLE
jgi:hypothetical protein